MERLLRGGQGPEITTPTKRQRDLLQNAQSQDETFTHLYDNYGNISPQDLSEKNARLKALSIVLVLGKQLGYDQKLL